MFGTDLLEVPSVYLTQELCQGPAAMQELGEKLAAHNRKANPHLNK